jgi:hypothetical protein
MVQAADDEQASDGGAQQHGARATHQARQMTKALSQPLLQ